MADSKGKYRTEIQQVRGLCDISLVANNPLLRQENDTMSVDPEDEAVYAERFQMVVRKHFGALSEIVGAVPVYV